MRTVSPHIRMRIHKKVIMVTSTVPNEGKSYISQSLWLELAKAGRG